MSNNSSHENTDENQYNSNLNVSEALSPLTAVSQESLKASQQSSRDSTFRSPRTKKTKMVHAPAVPPSEDNANKIFLEQLALMRSRVSLLDVSDTETEHFMHNAPLAAERNIIYVKPAECIENISEIGDENISLGEGDIHFDDSLAYSNTTDNSPVSNRNNIATPRMLEVPPKKVCVRLKTPIFERDVHQQSDWAKTSPLNSTKEQSTNTEGTWRRVSSFEELQNFQKVRLATPLDPHVLIHKKYSSSTSRTSIEDVKFDTTSNITSIESPECMTSHCSPSYTEASPKLINQDYLSPRRTDTDSHIMSIEGLTQDSWTDDDKELIVPQLDIPEQTYNTGTTLTSAVRSLSSNVKKFFKKNQVTPASEPKESAQEEELEYIPEEVEMRTINYSDYDMPLKNLGEIENITVKDVVSNLALHFFKSKDNMCTQDEVCRDVDVEEKVSFRSLAEEVPVDLSANERKAQEIRRILNENIESFRSKNVYTNRRPQATQFRYYNVVNSTIQHEVGAGENTLRRDSVQNLDAIERVEHDEDDDETVQSPPGCCTLRACAEFMFPKRPPRFFF